MRLALHHLRKDIRAMWPLLVLWVGILSIRLLWATGEPFEGGFQRQRLESILMMVQWALTAVLPAMLILQDPVHGAQAFWLTRPISRLERLVSKTLGLGLLFVVVPLAFQLASLLRVGLGGRALAFGLAEAALQIGGVVLAVAALASVSPGLARFVVLLLICLVGAKLVAPALMLIAPPDATGLDGWPSIWKSRDLAEMALLVLAAIGILGYQSLTRRTSRSLVLVGVGVLALSSVQAWTWDFLAPTAGVLKGAVTLDLEPPDDQRCFQRGANDGRAQICGRFLFHEVGTGVELQIEKIESRLVFPDGSSIEYRGGSPLAWTQSRTVMNRHLQPASGVADDPPPLFAHHTLLNPHRELFRKYAQVAGRLEADIVVASFHTRNLGALPIERGAQLRAGAAAALVDRVAISSGKPPTLHLDLRLRRAELLFEPFASSRPLEARIQHPIDDQPGLLHIGGSSGDWAFPILPRPRLHSQRIQQTLRFADRQYQSRAGQMVNPPTTQQEVREWLRDAEVVIRDRFRSSYRARIELDGFRMADYTPQEEG